MTHQVAEISDYYRGDAPADVQFRFRPLECRRLTELVYEALRKSMLDGKIRPGQRLDTKRLARDFGVSQTPVRHAVALLAKDGLIEIHPRRGTFVGTVSEERLSEIMDIRRALEILACETAMRRATENDIAHLRSLANEISGTVDPDNVSFAAAKRHDELNLNFHQSFVALSGNQHLVRVYDDLEIHQFMATIHQRFHIWGRSIAEESKQHNAIVIAIANRELNELRRAVNRHMRYSRALLTKAMHRGDEEVVVRPRARNASTAAGGQ